MPKKTYEELLGLKKMQEIALERLHPPMAPKPVVSEKSVEQTSDVEKGTAQRTDSKLAIDFSYLTNNSSFQRGVMEFIKKFVPGLENVDARGSKKVMARSFNQNVANYREVMKELKAKLKEKRGDGS